MNSKVEGSFAIVAALIVLFSAIWQRRSAPELMVWNYSKSPGESRPL